MIWRVAFPSGNERPHFIGVDFVTCPALSARDRGAGATAQSPDDFGWRGSSDSPPVDDEAAVAEPDLEAAPVDEGSDEIPAPPELWAQHDDERSTVWSWPRP